MRDSFRSATQFMLYNNVLAAYEELDEVLEAVSSNATSAIQIIGDTPTEREAANAPLEPFIEPSDNCVVLDIQVETINAPNEPVTGLSDNGAVLNTEVETMKAPIEPPIGPSDNNTWRQQTPTPMYFSIKPSDNSGPRP